MSGVMWDAAGSMDVLELLSQLRATLNRTSSAAPELLQLIDAAIYADPGSSMVEKQFVARLKGEVADHIAAKRWGAHVDPAFLTISALEASIQRRSTGSD